MSTTLEEPVAFTDADWAEAITTDTFPIDDTLTAEPVTAPPESTSERRVDLSYLLNAMHWLPLDYSATDLPALGELTRDHQVRSRGIDSKALRAAHISYATLASAAGVGLNATSWMLATLSTGINRGLVSGEAWNGEQGRALRPRTLLALARDNADRAEQIDNTVLRSLFILTAAIARVTAQGLNLASYSAARLAVTLNSPHRLGTAAIPVAAVLVAWVAWIVAGGA